MATTVIETTPAERESCLRSSADHLCSVLADATGNATAALSCYRRPSEAPRSVVSDAVRLAVAMEQGAAEIRAALDAPGGIGRLIGMYAGLDDVHRRKVDLYAEDMVKHQYYTGLNVA